MKRALASPEPPPVIPGTPPGPCSEPQPFGPTVDDLVRLIPQSQLALAS
jgi:hypothetical protein